MEIKSSQAEQTRVLEISGRLDNLTSPELEGRIQAALDALPPALVLDFAAVEFLSSAGLRVMLSAAKRCRKTEHETGVTLAPAEHHRRV